MFTNGRASRLFLTTGAAIGKHLLMIVSHHAREFQKHTQAQRKKSLDILATTWGKIVNSYNCQLAIPENQI
jgi:hypothetical protein